MPKVDWDKRKMAHETLLSHGAINHLTLHEYERVMRFHSDGFTEKERVAYQKRIIRYREAVEDMQKFRDHVHNSIKRR